MQRIKVIACFLIGLILSLHFQYQPVRATSSEKEVKGVIYCQRPIYDETNKLNTWLVIINNPDKLELEVGVGVWACKPGQYGGLDCWGDENYEGIESLEGPLHKVGDLTYPKKLLEPEITHGAVLRTDQNSVWVVYAKPHDQIWITQWLKVGGDGPEFNQRGYSFNPVTNCTQLAASLHLAYVSKYLAELQNIMNQIETLEYEFINASVNYTLEALLNTISLQLNSSVGLPLLQYYVSTALSLAGHLKTAEAKSKLIVEPGFPLHYRTEWDPNVLKKFDELVKSEFMQRGEVWERAFVQLELWEKVDGKLVKRVIKLEDVTKESAKDQVRFDLNKAVKTAQEWLNEPQIQEALQRGEYALEDLTHRMLKEGFVVSFLDPKFIEEQTNQGRKVLTISKSHIHPRIAEYIEGGFKNEWWEGNSMGDLRASLQYVKAYDWLKDAVKERGLLIQPTPAIGILIDSQGNFRPLFVDYVIKPKETLHLVKNWDKLQEKFEKIKEYTYYSVERLVEDFEVMLPGKLEIPYHAVIPDFLYQRYVVEAQMALAYLQRISKDISYTIKLVTAAEELYAKYEKGELSAQEVVKKYNEFIERTPLPEVEEIVIIDPATKKKQTFTLVKIHGELFPPEERLKYVKGMAKRLFENPDLEHLQPLYKRYANLWIEVFKELHEFLKEFPILDDTKLRDFEAFKQRYERYKGYPKKAQEVLKLASDRMLERGFVDWLINEEVKATKLLEETFKPTVWDEYQKFLKRREQLRAELEELEKLTPWWLKKRYFQILKIKEEFDFVKGVIGKLTLSYYEQKLREAKSIAEYRSLILDLTDKLSEARERLAEMPKDEFREKLLKVLQEFREKLNEVNVKKLPQEIGNVVNQYKLEVKKLLDTKEEVLADELKKVASELTKLKVDVNQLVSQRVAQKLEQLKSKAYNSNSMYDNLQKRLNSNLVYGKLKEWLKSQIKGYIKANQLRAEELSNLGIKSKEFWKKTFEPWKAKGAIGTTAFFLAMDVVKSVYRSELNSLQASGVTAYDLLGMISYAAMYLTIIQVTVDTVLALVASASISAALIGTGFVFVVTPFVIHLIFCYLEQGHLPACLGAPVCDYLRGRYALTKVGEQPRDEDYKSPPIQGQLALDQGGVKFQLLAKEIFMANTGKCPVSTLLWEGKELLMRVNYPPEEGGGSWQGWFTVYEDRSGSSDPCVLTKAGVYEVQLLERGYDKFWQKETTSFYNIGTLRILPQSCKPEHCVEKASLKDQVIQAACQTGVCIKPCPTEFTCPTDYKCKEKMCVPRQSSEQAECLQRGKAWFKDKCCEQLSLCVCAECAGGCVESQQAESLIKALMDCLGGKLKPDRCAELVAYFQHVACCEAGQCAHKGKCYDQGSTLELEGKRFVCSDGAWIVPAACTITKIEVVEGKLKIHTQECKLPEELTIEAYP